MPNDSTMQLVVCSLGDEVYALPITHVEEMIHCTETRGIAGGGEADLFGPIAVAA